MFNRGNVMPPWGPAAIGVSFLLLTGCGTSVPEQQDFPMTATQGQILVNEIIKNVSCEVYDAINYVYNQDAITQEANKDHFSSAKFLDNWGAQLTLTLKVEEKSSVNPSIDFLPAAPVVVSLGLGLGASADATRTNIINWYYTVDEIRKFGFCDRSKHLNGPLLLQNDLKLREWILDSMMASGSGEIRMPTDTKSPLKQNVLSHEVRFEIIASGNATPAFKLTNFTVNQTGSFLTGSRDKTHDLLITLGPTDTGSDGQPKPSEQAANVHLAQQIGLAVSNGIRNALP
jgi:hypothetical protein